MIDPICTNCGKFESVHFFDVEMQGQLFCTRKALSKTFSTKPKPQKNPLEKEIEKAVCDYAKSLGCLVYKFTSISMRSVPDRLFIMPAGKGVFFVEFKRRGEVPTPAQEAEIAKIRAKGTAVYVVDNVEAGKATVDRALTVLEVKQVTLDEI